MNPVQSTQQPEGGAGMSENTTWAAIGSLATVLLTAIVAAFRSIYKTVHGARTDTRKATAEETRVNRKDAIDGLWDLVNGLRSDLETIKGELRESREDAARRVEEERKRTEECQEQHNEQVRFRTRAEAWIEGLQQVLRSKRIPFVAYQADPGSVSDVHRVFRPPQPPPGADEGEAS